MATSNSENDVVQRTGSEITNTRDGDDGDEEGDDDVVAENDEEEDVVPVASVVGASRSNFENDSDEEADADEADDDGDGDAVHEADGEAEEETASHATDAGSQLSRTPPPPPRKRAHSEMSEMTPSPGTTPTTSPRKTNKKRKNFGVGRHSRSPAVPSLTIPFRQVKRTMKLDQDIGTVQNEAAMLVTHATEMFLKKFALESYELAKKKGRNTIKYEDVAEARARNGALSFLDLLLP